MRIDDSEEIEKSIVCNMLETDCTPEINHTRSAHQIYRVEARRSRWIIRAAAGLGCFLTTIVPLSGTEWVQVNSGQNVAVYAKNRPGTSIKELRAVGIVDAPSWVILNVLDEVADYPSFMPYTTKAQLIERRGKQAIIYFRWDPPLIGARDATVEVTQSAIKRPDGKTNYQLNWEAITNAGPVPAPGVTRITLDEGSWELEPTEDGKKTTVIYNLFTDGGGGLPSFAVNIANKQSVNDLFQAIRKQVMLPKYSQKNSEE